MRTLVPALASGTAVLVAAFLAFVVWATWREHRAVLPAGATRARRRPLPTGCDLGAQLMAASATTGGGGGRGARTGPGGAAPKRNVSTGPTRREFLRNSWFASLAVGVGAFGAGSLAMLWPDLSGGFGAEIDVDDVDAVLDEIRTSRSPYQYRPGRFYLVEYNAELDPTGAYAEITNGGEAPVMALYQKCVHLGCAVPWCLSAQWFQCPCHGSNYNRWGEYQRGPAPRGLDRFNVRIENNRVLVDTSTVVTGPARDANVLVQPQEGPSCISA